MIARKAAVAAAGVALAALWAQQPAMDVEKQLRSFPDPVRARQYMQRMAAEPHHAGSPASKAVAEYALGLFKEWGYDARIEEFEALLPYPTTTLVELTAPVKKKLALKEPAMAADPDSTDRNQLPLYNAYSASGDVTAPLVYVNYGVPRDYETLAKLGIDVKGKIVLARYGGSWRGTKPKVAAEHGAVGCLIYSDPRDDGFYQGDVFPRGPYRPRESAQRGSVMDMPLYVGDPLSPGWASEKGSRRLERSEAQSLMKIPVLPISWADAQPLLENLGGPLAPVDWRGAVPVTYHVGAGPAVVRIKTEFDWTTKPLYNVIARMPGAVNPDEWVIYGNHHDAWVNGASDPISGAVALMESARAFSQLKAATGWRPRRTLMFALWDGEEFGLIGSTEWVEKHRDELQRKTVAYINTDSNTGGKLGAGGSPVLEKMFAEVVRDTGVPADGKPMTLGPLGAGSDYVAFVHHAGIPSLNLGFSQPGNAGTYHSIYDSYAWFAAHMDKDFEFSRKLAQVTATTMLRLSESAVVPFDFGAVARSTREWTAQLAKDHPKLNLSPVNQQLAALDAAAARFSSAKPGAVNAARLNQLLMGAERALTRAAGLPARTWYKHELYAPGLYTGYSARTLPAIREPADRGRMAEAAQQVEAVAGTLRGFTALVTQAADLAAAGQ